MYCRLSFSLCKQKIQVSKISYAASFLGIAGLVTIAISDVPGASYRHTRLKEATGYHCECDSGPSNAGIPFTATSQPISRILFNKHVADAQAKVAQLGLPSQALEVVQDVSIKFTQSNGAWVKWEFNADGNVVQITDGINILRFNNPESPLYGYSVKAPSHGYAELTPILSTTTNELGEILSFTYHPTNETTQIPGSSVSTLIDPVARINSRSENKAALGTALENCVKGCNERRNDDRDADAEQVRNCLESARQDFENCMTIGLVGGILAGGGVGAGVGSVAGGVGALPGALFGGGVGAIGTSTACFLNGMARLNQCKRLAEALKNGRVRDHNKCVVRCYERYD